MVLAGGASARARAGVLAALDAWQGAGDNLIVLFQAAGRPLCFRGLYALPVRPQLPLHPSPSIEPWLI